MAWKSIAEGAGRSFGMQLTNEFLSRPEGQAIVAGGVTAAIALAPAAATVAAVTLGICGGAVAADYVGKQIDKHF